MTWTITVTVYIKPKKKNEPGKSPKKPLVWKIFNLMDIQTNQQSYNLRFLLLEKEKKQLFVLHFTIKAN